MALPADDDDVVGVDVHVGFDGFEDVGVGVTVFGRFGYAASHNRLALSPSGLRLIQTILPDCPCHLYQCPR